MLTDDLIDLTDLANPLALVPSEPSEQRPGAYEIVEHLDGRWVASELAPGRYPTAGRAYEVLLDELVELPVTDLVLGIRDLRTGEVIVL